MSTKNPKLHEIVAVRKGIKSRVYSEITTLHRGSDKADLYNGLLKEYTPKDDEAETLPSEKKKVQKIVEDILKQTAKLQTEAWDIEATQEYGNQTAKADLVVAGQTLLSDVPVTLLIYLEKQLNDLRTFVANLPTLDDAKDWEADPNSKLFRTKPTRTHHNRAVEKQVVVVQATKEHPAQWTTVKDNVVAGYWDKTFFSGALPVPRKEDLVERIDKLQIAVKEARSRANGTEVERKNVGDAVFGYLFA
jgi:hypothetical protein